ncbi:MAG: hypothetical protein AAFO07_12980 [Bacteroidota bacterium]
MGAYYSHYKIRFKDEKHSDFLNKLFLDFQDFKFPEILNEENPLAELFNTNNYAKIKHALAFAWCCKGEGLAIENFQQDERFFELEIYGGSDMVMMEELIFNASYHWGVENYMELQSTTRANGLNFKWIKNSTAFQYYDDQSENSEELNLNNGFDYCFNYVDKLVKKDKFETSEIKVRLPDELEFLRDLKVYPDFLALIEVSNKKWEIEQEKNRQRVPINNNYKLSKQQVGFGIRALFKRNKKK